MVNKRKTGTNRCPTRTIDIDVYAYRCFMCGSLNFGCSLGIVLVNNIVETTATFPIHTISLTIVLILSLVHIPCSLVGPKAVQQLFCLQINGRTHFPRRVRIYCFLTSIYNNRSLYLINILISIPTEFPATLPSMSHYFNTNYDSSLFRISSYCSLVISPFANLIFST